jgi:hypothetical protein
MRACYPTRRTYQPDNLSARNRIPGRDKWFAHVEVRGDDSSAVIDVDDIAGEEKIRDQCYYSAIRHADRISNAAAKIHAEMPSRQPAIEQAP